jgi:hypothetical protein
MRLSVGNTFVIHLPKEAFLSECRIFIVHFSTERCNPMDCESSPLAIVRKSVTLRQQFEMPLWFRTERIDIEFVSNSESVL